MKQILNFLKFLRDYTLFEIFGIITLIAIISTCILLPTSYPEILLLQVSFMLIEILLIRICWKGFKYMWKDFFTEIGSPIRH